jgi:hypothetical protein
MQYVAGCLVWLIVFLIFLIWVVITCACLLKGGSFFGIEIPTNQIMTQAVEHADSHADTVNKMGRPTYFTKNILHLAIRGFECC